MEDTIKADQIPTAAHRLYIQLYCERKGQNDRQSIIEARKSWASLSKFKKHLFYKTAAHGNSLNYAHTLSKTTLYLKEKVTEGNKSSDQQQNHTEHLQATDARYPLEGGSQLLPEVNEVICIGTNENREESQKSHINESGQSFIFSLAESTLPVQNCITEDALESQNNSSTQTPPIPLAEPSSSTDNNRRDDTQEIQSNIGSVNMIEFPLAEPTPPTVKIGKDLYEAMRRPDEPDFKDLDKKDRRHFNIAVQTIKRDYIKKYTKYLESLSQQQLFEHYIKTFH